VSRLARFTTIAAAVFLASGVVVLATCTCVLPGSGGGAPLPGPEGREPVTGANVWVDRNGGACARSRDPREYEDAAACASFEAAYAVASCGDLVVVKAGRYSGQLLTYSSGKGDACKGSPVALEAEPGETVTLAATSVDAKSLQVGQESLLGARDLTFRGFSLAGAVYLYPGARRITLEGLTGRSFFLRCAHFVTLRGNTWTDPQATSVPTISSAWTIGIPSGAEDVCGSTGAPSTEILIENDRFFRIWRPRGDTSSHRECLHIMGADGLTIRNSRFHECLGNTAAISLNVHGGSKIENTVIEGNSIWKTYNAGAHPQPTGEGPAFNIGGGDCDQNIEALIRFNTLHLTGGVAALACPTGDGILFDSNLWLRSALPCSGRQTDYTWRYNIVESGTWGALCDDVGNRVGFTRVEDRANGDLRLASGSFAVGKGNPTAHPPSDLFGTIRPRGSAPDVGFHEKE